MNEARGEIEYFEFQTGTGSHEKMEESVFIWKVNVEIGSNFLFIAVVTAVATANDERFSIIRSYALTVLLRQVSMVGFFRFVLLFMPAALLHRF